MSHKVYLDESGDLGWNFTNPYRAGGSSRYLTIAYLIVPDGTEHLPRRFVKRIYDKYGFNPKDEIKGKDFYLDEKEYIAQRILDLLNKNPEFKLGAITVEKEKVAAHIRQDANKLYNYMMRLSILDKIDNYETAKLIRDERSVKVKSGNSCADYLQMTLWFDHKSTTTLVDIPSTSHNVTNLIFIDWVCNMVWSKYEDHSSSPFDILSAKLFNQTLFF